MPIINVCATHRPTLIRSANAMRLAQYNRNSSHYYLQLRVKNFKFSVATKNDN